MRPALLAMLILTIGIGSIALFNPQIAEGKISVKAIVPVINKLTTADTIKKAAVKKNVTAKTYRKPKAIIKGTNGSDNIYVYDTYYPTHTTLLKLDQNLNQQWVQSLNFPYTSSPFGVFQASDGGYIIFAMFQSFNNYTDLAYIKTDAHGNVSN